MALGHWLKDYIGPHNGAGSGGSLQSQIIHATLIEDYDEATEEYTYRIEADKTPDEVSELVGHWLMELCKQYSTKTMILNSDENGRFSGMFIYADDNPVSVTSCSVSIADHQWVYSEHVLMGLTVEDQD